MIDLYLVFYFDKFSKKIYLFRNSCILNFMDIYIINDCIITKNSQYQKIGKNNQYIKECQI